MKNEALERLWRMLNIADIEGKGASQYVVQVWLEEVKNTIEYAEINEQDTEDAYDSGYSVGYDAGYDEGRGAGYDDGYDTGHAVCVAEYEQ